MDLDWDHVRAVDILAVLRSFVPKGGAIQRVVVYPSGAPASPAFNACAALAVCASLQRCPPLACWLAPVIAARRMCVQQACISSLARADYGLERMAKEAVMGPQGIFKPAAPKGSGKQQGKGAAAAAQGSDSEEEEEEEEVREEGMSSDEEEEGAEGGSSSESGEQVAE